MTLVVVWVRCEQWDFDHGGNGVVVCTTRM
jgi:hypothetical protein